MTEPIDQATKDLIEKEAISYVIQETGYQVLPEHFNWKKAYIAGASVWAERLKQERNKAIDECIGQFNKYLKNWKFSEAEIIKILESIKDKIHE